MIFAHDWLVSLSKSRKERESVTRRLRARVAAEAWKCVNFCGVWIARGVGFSLRGLLGQGRILGVLLLRGAGVREEENEWHTYWNGNWSISDVKSKVNPYSSFFDCSINLSAF